LSLADQLAAEERRILVETLAEHGGNRTHAARDLGISYQALLRRCHALGIELDARTNQHAKRRPSIREDQACAASDIIR
jgi:DNA-binding NtrC family response regulator